MRAREGYSGLVVGCYFWCCFLSSVLCKDFEACLFACRCIKGEPAIEEYYEMYSEAEQYSNQISEAIMQTPGAQTFLTHGRVVVVKSQSVSSHL